MRPSILPEHPISRKTNIRVANCGVQPRFRNCKYVVVVIVYCLFEKRESFTRCYRANVEMSDQHEMFSIPRCLVCGRFVTLNRSFLAASPHSRGPRLRVNVATQKNIIDHNYTMCFRYCYGRLPTFRPFQDWRLSLMTPRGNSTNRSTMI